METLRTNIKWIDELLPDGLPIKTSTIITGAGGTGKPLIGETFVSAWLKNGGSVIFMSLQYPSIEFITKSIENVSGLNLNDYDEKIIFLQLDVGIPDIIDSGNNTIRANLVKPEIWDKALNISVSKLHQEEPGILIFGSALNILLFSPTYGDAIFNKIKETIAKDKSKTYIFSVSTSAKAEEISKIEKVADNLFIARAEQKPFRLFLKVLRMKDVRYHSNEILVPISPKILKYIKKIADHNRNTLIPAISKI